MLKALHIFMCATQKEGIVKTINMEHVLLADSSNEECVWVAILTPEWQWLMILEAPPTAIHQPTENQPIYMPKNP